MPQTSVSSSLAHRSSIQPFPWQSGHTSVLSMIPPRLSYAFVPEPPLGRIISTTFPRASWIRATSGMAPGMECVAHA
jgi:hypothetical protein